MNRWITKILQIFNWITELNFMDTNSIGVISKLSFRNMLDDFSFLHDGPLLSIETILKQMAINKYHIQVIRALPKGENYFGIIFRVTVTTENIPNVFNFIVKMAMGEDVPRTALPLTLMYGRENLMYTELLPLYKQLQEEAGIPVEEQFKFTHCYDASDEKFKEYMIFDDLKVEGYRLMDRKIDIDYDHTRIVLENLGKLHAMSFVLKAKQPNRFKYFSDNLTELIYTGSEWIMNFTKTAFQKARGVAKDENHKRILERCEDNIMGRFMEIQKCDEYSVIAHNDSWINNMMFRYENDKPVEVRLFDYQISRLGSLEADLHTFIFTSTGQKVRQAHYEDILSAYHNSMKKHLEAFGLDIRDIYPWTKFKNEMKRKSVIALFMGILYAVVTTPESDLAPTTAELSDMSKSDFVKTEASEPYKKRINEILEDLTSLGYLELLN